MHTLSSHPAFPARRQRSAGFTLIELLIAMAIIGILTAIAFPSYKTHMMKSKRGAAQAQMMDIASREEQFLLGGRTYATKEQLTDSGYTLPADVSQNYSYDIAVGTSAAPSFEITFTAIDNQLSDGDLTLNSAGVKGPANKW